VLIVPQLGVNLLSVGKLMQKGAYISFDLEKPYIAMGSRRTALRLCDGLYRWMVIPEYSGGDLPAAYVGVSFDVAHDRLCHRILPDNVKLEGAAGAPGFFISSETRIGSVTSVKRLSTITYLFQRSLTLKGT